MKNDEFNKLFNNFVPNNQNQNNEGSYNEDNTVENEEDDISFEDLLTVAADAFARVGVLYNMYVRKSKKPSFDRCFTLEEVADVFGWKDVKDEED